MSVPRLYIASRDPRDGGGVLSMVNSVYRAADKAGYDPCIVCNMLDDRSQVRLTKPLRAVRLDVVDHIEHFTFKNMETKGIPLIFPEVEFTHYFLNRAGWQKATEDGDAFFAVGGTNQCNIPFVDQERSFGSWTATLLWEDRVDRLQSAPLIEQIRDRVSRPILESLERRAFEAADPTIVLSEYTAERVRTKYGIQVDNVIPYPIDTDRFSAEQTGEIIVSNDPVVLFVGRFNDPRKNTPLLIEAFAEVRTEIPEAQLWLIGDEPGEEVEAEIARHSLANAVTFHGSIPNEKLPKYYRASDLFAIPSNQEGLAIVGLEAMACGTPVVATQCGGPEQYVIDDETGYLIPKGDSEQMANRIITILSNEDRRERLSQASKKVIRENYDASKIQTQFQRIIDKLYRK